MTSAQAPVRVLPEEFTLGELQDVYEAILGRPLDKRYFRRRMELLDVLIPLERWRVVLLLQGVVLLATCGCTGVDAA